MSGINAIAGLSTAQVRTLSRIRELTAAIAQNNLRLTTLKRINSAKDDPSGLVQAGLLRQELTAAEAAAESVTRANALLSTADSATAEIVTQLQAARTLASAVAGGGLTASEIAAKQVELDAIVHGIDTLARTEFAGQRLFDGSSSFRTTGVDTSKILDVDVLDKQAASDVTVSINVTQQATKAADTYNGGTLGSATTLLVTGEYGTTTISLSARSSTQDIEDAFNSMTYLTGITADRQNANRVDFSSVGYGSEAQIQIQATQGTFTTTSGGNAAGTNAVATINGQTVTGTGSSFYVSTSQVTLSIDLAQTASGNLTPFTVTGEGLAFVVDLSGTSTQRFGLPNLNSATLGGSTGKLNSLLSGGANPLTGGKANEALQIIDDALAEATAAQAALGSFQRYTIESAGRVLDATIDNTSTALSAIEDADIALETALLTNNQLLLQTAYQSLSITSLLGQDVLSLLSSVAARA